MYELPASRPGCDGTGTTEPDGAAGSARRSWSSATRTARTPSIIRDRLHRKIEPYTDLPVALTEDQPLATKSLEQALGSPRCRWSPAWGPAPSPAILPLTSSGVCRRRLAAGASLPQPGADQDRFIDAITAAVLALDHSYLAVQGPPGTGKTYVGVPRHRPAGGPRLEESASSAQSHAVVENLLKTASRRPGSTRRWWPKT